MTAARAKFAPGVVDPLQPIETRGYEQSVRKGGSLSKHELLQLHRDRQRLKPQNEKMEFLTQNVNEMDHHFDELQKAREALRKLYEERHQEVLEKIQETRDDITAESKALQNEVRQFSTKFTHDQEVFAEEYKDAISRQRAEIDRSVGTLVDRSNTLELGIEQERQDRLDQTKDEVRPLQVRLEHLENQLQNEIAARELGHKQVLEQIREAGNCLRATLKEESIERDQQSKEHSEFFRKRQDALIKDQEKQDSKVISEIEMLRVEIESEADDRARCQDLIIDNVVGFLKSFEDNIQENNRQQQENQRTQKETLE